MQTLETMLRGSLWATTLNPEEFDAGAARGL